jgi:hypothetical protein
MKAVGKGRNASDSSQAIEPWLVRLAITSRTAHTAAST